MTEVVIEFPDDNKAKAFMEWMNNSGEQDYWSGVKEIEVVENFEYDFDDFKIIGEDLD